MPNAPPLAFPREPVFIKITCLSSQGPRPDPLTLYYMETGTRDSKRFAHGASLSLASQDGSLDLDNNVLFP